MTNPLKRIGDGAASLFGLVFPMFAWGRVGAAEHDHPAGRWVARLVALGAILGSLWWLNHWSLTGLRNLSVYASDYWLPLLAFCLYSMIWLGWWLYRVLCLEIEPAPSEFRDIDEAWDHAVEALRKAEIALDGTPLFLVLGWTAGSEDALFRAANLRALVRQEPKDPAAPLHVTATRDAVWLTCPGVCELSQHDPALSGDAPMETSLASLAGETASGSSLVAPEGTLRVQDILKGKNLDEVLATHKRIAARKNVDAAMYRARLRHLSRLVARDRLGLCPVNGILVALPVDTVDSSARAQAVAASCRSDLTICHDIFRLRCPVVVLFADMETLDGFGEVIERLPAGMAGKRLGQEFPLVPDVRDGEAPERIQSAVEWIAETSFPALVYSLLQVEAPGGEGLPEVLAANSRLFQVVTAMRDRQAKLAQLVRDALPALPGEPLLFRGCYLAGTGADAAGQAFVGGVLKKLVSNQDHVTWTADYIAEDVSLHRATTVAKVVLGSIFGFALAVAVGFGGYLLWTSRGAGASSGSEAPSP